MLPLALLVSAFVGYLLGNINGAVIISNRVLREDIRTKGSGNAGATNFFRNYGAKITILVLLIDVAKTGLACLLGLAISRLCGLPSHADASMLGGIGVVIGHMFPVFLHFHGGKGVLCGASLALFMCPQMFAILFAVFLGVFLATHYVSLASFSAAVLYPLCFWLQYPGDRIMLISSLCAALLSIFMHRNNYVRLFRGTETKTYLRKH